MTERDDLPPVDGDELFDHTPQWLALDAQADRPVPLHDTAAIRALEQAAMADLPPFTLMARAGAAAAAWLRHHEPAGPLLLLAGGGNNGGDALVAATLLHHAGRTVDVWLTADPARLPDDAARAWREADEAGVPMRTVYEEESPPAWPDDVTAIVDGLLGIGLRTGPGRPPLDGPVAQWIRRLDEAAASGKRVYALDVPSGLSADTGAAPLAVRAVRTLTFLAAKPGLLTAHGRDRAGAIDVAPLGLPGPGARTPAAWLNTPARFAGLLPRRRHDSHKGSFGTVGVLGGNTGMVGAPLLGARAALHLGAGRVHVGFLAAGAPAFDPLHPELMLHAAAELPLHALSAIVAGPGLGSGESAVAALLATFDTDHPLVLDADALNLLASDTQLAARLRQASQPRVLTPHPLEAARLLGCDVAEVQGDRLGAARRLAQDWAAVIVLKGSGTIVAAVDDDAPALNPTGNAGLATAGTGDVLAGMIGALLAQGMPPAAAAQAAVWLHGQAADDLVAAGQGPAGLVASELFLAARARLNRLA
ncbi:NAD(P)H-hydrate dehydratase [Cupriavidus sp. AU9028]|uniref:NAD(P)H-hydrate dehydratase n=1 Tax=Cupriavidus sp. AU9028 TaxID=2871157 RepID=UPI001C94827B|nr:NAD(P)H-hydrate dehydratase [Cupriavidus sp. AU9028]MBY4897553.1 NAD(P)H-hydrate dehydratase [Cupriavidus sp. AU9028]